MVIQVAFILNASEATCKHGKTSPANPTGMTLKRKKMTKACAYILEGTLPVFLWPGIRVACDQSIYPTMHPARSARHDWLRCACTYVATDTLHAKVLGEVSDMQADGSCYKFLSQGPDITFFHLRTTLLEEISSD